MKTATRIALAALVLPLLAAAHKEAHTTEEIEVQRALQAAAYHCAPAVAQFTAERKRSWAQKVLGGRPSLAGYEDLFDPQTYADLDVQSGQKLLSCVEEQEADIRNNSCVLAPEVTQGPYYHSEAHLIRQNIAEFQFGLLTLLDIGVIDVETCLPLPNALVDIWHANATGDYAGHPFPFPGLENEMPATEGIRKGLKTGYPRLKGYEGENWLRGAWPTNARGVAQFSSIFPGYYTGRALHIHTKVFTDWTPQPNGAFKAGRLAHTGQFFFDDDISETINKMWPYSTNPIRDTHGRVRNWNDGLNIFNDSQGPEGHYDPIFRLEKLGAIIDQGLVGFITMGINASAAYALA
ncbi:aromatic compound dioxygenase [Athelia psychrophila]|uniref:Aromatic compound dioxygenase n=1 Tax=Athelia psychrophila TaxID=1759441 RepID=A0A166LXG7_9AGAM|nr:aromatic compound dioxygenase [Fibularhizoctonia sp. CBS 109695]